MGKPPEKKITEVEALLAIAKAINRLASAAETLASPPDAEPKEEEEKAEDEASHEQDD